MLQIALNFSHVPFHIGNPLSLILTVWQYKNINEYFGSLPFFTWSIFFFFGVVFLLCYIMRTPFHYQSIDVKLFDKIKV